MEEYMEEFYDEIAGKKLNAEEVMRARRGELDEVERLQVWDKADIDECWRHTGKSPITARWVDGNKGDEENHNYRSRFVAREIKSKYGGTGREDLFAATLPWEAIKLRLSKFTTDY